MGECRFEGNQPIYVDVMPVFGQATPSHNDITKRIEVIRQRVTTAGFTVVDIIGDVSTHVVGPGKPTAAIRVRARLA